MDRQPDFTHLGCVGEGRYDHVALGKLDFRHVGRFWRHGKIPSGWPQGQRTGARASLKVGLGLGCQAAARPGNEIAALRSQ